jgi:hypothetical protein
MQEQELDCSPAAKMLIERMQTHPEDFMYGGKLYRMTEQAQMSARDKKAYNAAHDLYLLEPQLMARVLEKLLAQPDEDERMPKLTAQRMGQYDPRLIYGNAMAGEIVEYDSTTYNPATNQQRIAREMMDMHNRVETQSRPPTLLNKLFKRGT